MKTTSLNLIREDDLYFCRVANQHHKDIKKANKKQLQPAASKTLSVLGSLSIVFGVLYWLATLGV